MQTQLNTLLEKPYPSKIVCHKPPAKTISYHYDSIDGSLSFYKLQSISRVPLLKNIKIAGRLQENGRFTITIDKEELTHEIEAMKTSVKCPYGFGFTVFPGTVFFTGSFMDGFSYNDLSENPTTYIVNGKMLSLNLAKQVSFIGQLTKVANRIYLNSTITFACPATETQTFQQRTRPYLIGIAISMSFERNTRYSKIFK